MLTYRRLVVPHFRVLHLQVFDRSGSVYLGGFALFLLLVRFGHCLRRTVLWSGEREHKVKAEARWKEKEVSKVASNAAANLWSLCGTSAVLSSLMVLLLNRYSLSSRLP
jgi:hypothetical protein